MAVQALIPKSGKQPGYKMTDFIFAISSIIYALACLTREADLTKCSTSKSAKGNLKNEEEG
jgi:hypothetical protein